MSQNKVLNVKISPESDSSTYLPISESNSIFGNCMFHHEEEFQECDYWVLAHDFKYEGTAICPPENTIFVTGEPASVKKYSNKYLKQFATIVTSQENLSHSNVIETHQVLSWGFHKSYDELNRMKPFEKSKFMSIISSNKRFSKGHEQRYQFAKNLKRHFGDTIDLYGRGICDFESKWDVIAPYTFSIAVENSSSKNYITEKLTECFLSYTFPLYYGCPNVDDYYPKGSYEWIDISDKEGSVDLIEKIRHDPNYYQKHLPAVCDARKRYLEQYDFYPLLAGIIVDLEEKKECFGPKKEMHISPAGMTFSDLVFKGRCAAGLIKNAIDKNLRQSS